MATPSVAAAASTSTGGANTIPNQIAELAKLHQQGVLSIAEFNAAKARVLGLPSPPDAGGIAPADVPVAMPYVASGVMKDEQLD